jgi:hypothetical protein
MTTAEAIAQAVWEYVTRTLSGGVPDEPANQAEEIAEAVWEYVTRTLTAGGVEVAVLMHHYTHNMGRQ